MRMTAGEVEKTERHWGKLKTVYSPVEDRTRNTARTAVSTVLSSPGMGYTQE